MPLASARQHPENQKENQAGHSSERAVEGLGGRLALGSRPKGRGARPVKVSGQARSPGGEEGGRGEASTERGFPAEAGGPARAA